MDIFVGTSLLAAFIIGIAALFAPCCITVLLPSYFASIFRTRKKVFLMTFIFFLGILTVFLPLGLGMAVLGQIFSRYHAPIFITAGMFFILLGVSLVLGKRFMLPFSLHPSIAAHNIPSIFLLGIVSGIATTCCAPVLAGVIALSVLPGSVLWGGLYTLAYVLGMVTPLFVIAFFLDRVNLTQKLMDATAPITLPFGKGTAEVRLPDLISGITFLAMGALTLYWAFTGQVNTHGQYQIDVNIYLTKLQMSLNQWLGAVPQFVWALVFLGILALLARVAFKQFTGSGESNNHCNH
ncbi:MAG: hypothetical protein HYT39_02255 [Candidatus Sungbacteria bacterium]|nr:hypothetical protein [Candidatus Sungbacteria bacterium]